MLDTFTFKGTSSATMGILVTEGISNIIPGRRVEFMNIPGRNGSLTVTEGTQVYDDVTLIINCACDVASAASIASWLQGSGNLILSERTGGYYKATCVGEIEFRPALHNRKYEFSVEFRVKPFFYHNTSADITITSSGTNVTNPGTAFSEPSIKVTGTGDITLVIGSKSVIIAGLTGSITIDSELEEAFNGVTLMNSSMTGEFPTLSPGLNGVSWIGSVTSVVITPRWRSL